MEQLKQKLFGVGIVTEVVISAKIYNRKI